MNSINRKDFLRLGSLGAIATLLPVSQLHALNKITKTTNFDPSLHSKAVKLAAIAKEAFYKKDFDTAEKNYLKCIELAPADIRFYDNLQNVYTTQNKYLLAVQLFKQGLENNPEKIAFFDRLAKTLTQLAVGNKKIAKVYANSLNTSSLLEDAKSLYEKAIAIDTKKEYLKIGLNKTSYLIGINAANTNANGDIQRKARKKANRKLAKENTTYANLTTDELLAKLNSIDAKKRNQLYADHDIATRKAAIDKQKKRLYSRLVDKHYVSKDFEATINYAQMRYSIDKQDTESYRSLKHLYKKNKRFADLVSLSVERNNIKNDVWSKLGLVNAMELAYRNDPTSVNIEEAVMLCQTILSEENLKHNHCINTSVKLAKIYLRTGQINKAETLLIDLINNDSFKTNKEKTMVARSFVSTYIKFNRLAEAESMLKIALNKKEADTELYHEQTIKNLTRGLDKNSQRVCFEYQLFRVYKRLGEHQKKKLVLERILQQFPNDRFALKKSGLNFKN